MKRRQFLTLVGYAAARPTVSDAQHTTMPAVGFLGSESPARSQAILRGFRQGLAEVGYVEGHNVVVNYRWADGDNERLRVLADDLLRQRVAVIAAPGTTPAALAAKAVTTSVPVVFFTGGDPVALGLVASLGRPGGNLTGITSMGSGLAAKRLELLLQVAPRMKLFAALVNPGNPALTEANAKELASAAETLGVRMHIVRARTERELEDVFPAVASHGAGGLVITIDSFFTARRERLGTLARHHRIPAIYQHRDFTTAGGLMSYGASLHEGYRLAGVYTGRILKGDQARDLPVQQVKKIELIVNVTAAKELGVNVPASLRALADEIIE